MGSSLKARFCRSLSTIDSLGYVPPLAGYQMVPWKPDTRFFQEDISLLPTSTILGFDDFGKKITADFYADREWLCSARKCQNLN